MVVGMPQASLETLQDSCLQDGPKARLHLLLYLLL
jgi:hypothetical protein